MQKQQNKPPFSPVLLLLAFGWAVVCHAAAPVPNKPPAEDPGKKVNNLFNDITRNMKRIEDMLNKKQSGSETQKQQKALTHKMDDLIEALQKMQQSSQSGGGGGSSQDKQQKSGGSQGKDQKAEEHQRKNEGGKQGKEELQKRGKEQAKDQVQGENEKPKDGKGQTGEEQKRAPGEMNPESGQSGGANRFGGGWGFLPGEIRALLRARGRSGVPQKYADIIRRYFERLSEAGGR